MTSHFVRPRQVNPKAFDPDSSSAHVQAHEIHDASVNMEIGQPTNNLSVSQVTNNMSASQVTNIMSITSEDLRKGFVRKVLLILMSQLAVTTIFVAATLVESTGLMNFMSKNSIPTWISVVIAIISLCVLACWRDIFRKVPYNYLLLFTFTISSSYFFAGVAALTGSKIVLYSAGCTAGVTIGVSLYVCITKRDFTKQWYFIAGAIPIFFLLLVFAVVFRGNGLDYIFSGLFSLMYLCFFTFDIQRLAGRYESKFTLDEYIVAALDLYIDIVMMFLYMLDILICNGTHFA